MRKYIKTRMLALMAFAAVSAFAVESQAATVVANFKDATGTYEVFDDGKWWQVENHDNDGKAWDSNGGLVIYGGDGYKGRNIFGVIYGDTFYEVLPHYNNDPDAFDVIKFTVDFNPEDMTVVYTTDYGSKQKSLTSLPASQKFPASRKQ